MGLILGQISTICCRCLKVLGQVTVYIIVSLEPILWGASAKPSTDAIATMLELASRWLTPYSFSFLLGIGWLRISRHQTCSVLILTPGHHHLSIVRLLHLFGVKRMLADGRGCWASTRFDVGEWRSTETCCLLSLMVADLKVLRALELVFQVCRRPLRLVSMLTLVRHKLLLALHLLYLSDSRCYKEMCCGHCVCDCTTESLKSDTPTAIWLLKVAQDGHEVDLLVLVFLDRHSVVLPCFDQKSVNFIDLVLFEV